MTAAFVSRSTRISRVPATAAAMVGGLALLAVLAPTGALMLAPTALLVLALLRGSMPGERLLEQLRERRRPRRRVRRPLRRAARPAQPDLVAPAGRLCVSALAMRPPPRRPSLPLS